MRNTARSGHKALMCSADVGFAHLVLKEARLVLMDACCLLFPDFTQVSCTLLFPSVTSSREPPLILSG